jgi:hypothetical protein
MLSAVESALLGSADKTILNTTLPDGVQIGYCSKEDLTKWHSYWTKQVRAEERAQDAAEGKGRMIKVTFADY